MFVQQLSSWFQENLGLNPALQNQILRSIIAIVLLWVVTQLALRLLVNRIDDPSNRYRLQKITTYFVALIGFLIVGRIWFTGIQSLATFLGLVTAGLAIALKDPVTSLAGWLFIVWRRPFDVGDRIQIGDHMGDVIDLRIFQFTLLEIGNWVNADQSTGRIIHLPNSLIFTEPQANYSKGIRYIWNEIPVLITFESDWEKAKSLLQRIGNKRTEHLSSTARADFNRARRRFMLHDLDLAPKVFTSVEESGVLLTMRYLCEPRRRRTSAEGIWEEVLRAFADAPDIDFAYPTVRYFYNPREGKEGARATTPDGVESQEQQTMT